ncbi:MAG: hypothetical protein ACUVRA_08480 [Candidatus Bathyarchaeaceae archaeon]
MEKGYTLNNASLKYEEVRMTLMDPGTFFTIIMYLLMVLTFIVLILAFLYMIYGKEEKAK